MSKVITFGNFKGGVGKTTASCMFSYILQQQSYKVLLVDFDPQANSTNFLCKTFDIQLNEFVSIYEAIEQTNLRSAILNLNTNFDILPSAVDLTGYRDLIDKKAKGNKQHYFLAFLLEGIKYDYDFVIIDVPPTISEFTNNALVSSDHTLIIMQTEPDSLIGAIEYHRHAIKMSEEFNPKLKVSGILPYLAKKRSKIDQHIMKKSLSDESKIKDYIFKNHIYERERVKRFRINGIKNEDHHDKKVFKMYNNVVEELLEKVGMKDEKTKQ